jgi:glycosyltransferase involved in cell wall biosynthesis
MTIEPPVAGAQLYVSSRAADGPEDWGVQPRHAAWIEDFRRRTGRAPRVLGIGNIANNAFKNAVALRGVGVECDVLVYDYWHLMACPEWEEAHFDAAGMDNNAPDWSTVDLHGYDRPRWFAQGRLGTALDYLISLRENDEHTAALWEKLVVERNAAGGEATEIYQSVADPGDVEAIAEWLCLEFALRFPRRRDALAPGEILQYAEPFLEQLGRLRRLLTHYDVVIGYSIDGMIPLLAGKTPYIAFEHGTIRGMPFDRNFYGRMCALTYAMADQVLISNPDNILAAERLNLRDFRFIPHAILEDWRGAQDPKAFRDGLLSEHDADFVIFHPSRQHWSDARDKVWEKGNDILIEAFARLVKGPRPKALLMMIEWGVSVADSRALIDSLGIADRVVWLPPLPLRVMEDYLAASDVLADQFTIGGWGAILPIGAMLGTPILIYLDETFHRWCFPKLPPVYNGGDIDAVYASLVELLDAERAAAAGAAGRIWYDRYQSMSVVTGRLIDSLMAVDAVADEFAACPPPAAALALGRRLIASAAATAGLAVRLKGQANPPGDNRKAALTAEVRRIHGHQDVFCFEYWTNAGASVEIGDGGAVISTPPIAWHYAAGVRLDLATVDLDHEQAWVRVRVADLRGRLGVCLYDDVADRIVAEDWLDVGPGVREAVLKLDGGAARLLIFRSWDEDRSSRATFLGAEILVAPNYGVATDDGV